MNFNEDSLYDYKKSSIIETSHKRNEQSEILND